LGKLEVAQNNFGNGREKLKAKVGKTLGFCKGITSWPPKINPKGSKLKLKKPFFLEKGCCLPLGKNWEKVKRVFPNKWEP